MHNENSESYLQSAKRTFAIEARALQQTADALDELDFAKACDLLLRCRGRVVVSGIGKSGHIARKIASTLTSTGTPSIFLHPAEAAHGDIGLVSENDVLLVISRVENRMNWHPSSMLYRKKIFLLLRSLLHPRPGLPRQQINRTASFSILSLRKKPARMILLRLHQRRHSLSLVMLLLLPCSMLENLQVKILQNFIPVERLEES